MKNFTLFLISVLTATAHAAPVGSAYQPYRMPSSGTIPAFGALDISQSAAVTGILSTTNGGTGVNGSASFPTSGTIPTLTSNDSLSNKTLVAPTVTGTMAAATATFSGTITPSGGIVGPILVSSVHNNGGTGNGSNQAISSGTYSPTCTAGTGASSCSGGSAQWLRVGNVVFVSGNVAPTTTADPASVTITLPIALSSGTGGVGGTGMSSAVAGYWTVKENNTTTATVQGRGLAFTGAQNVTYSFGYTLN